MRRLNYPGFLTYIASECPKRDPFACHFGVFKPSQLVIRRP